VNMGEGVQTPIATTPVFGFSRSLARSCRSAGAGVGDLGGLTAGKVKKGVQVEDALLEVRVEVLALDVLHWPCRRHGWLLWVC